MSDPCPKCGNTTPSYSMGHESFGYYIRDGKCTNGRKPLKESDCIFVHEDINVVRAELERLNGTQS